MSSISRHEPVIIVVGPTAAGKSGLALALAAEFTGAILSADAMQVYRGFDLGTAKPTVAERSRVPHYLLDIADPRDAFSAGDFVRAADAAAEESRSLGLRPFLVGGSGFYVRAWLRGLVPAAGQDGRVRQRLQQRLARRGPSRMHRLLQRLDGEAAARLSQADRQRVLRALEVRLSTGRRLSALQADDGGSLWSEKERFPVIKIGLRRERADLVERIGARVAAFYAAGLVDEVRQLLDSGVPSAANAFKGIGYREALAVARGEMAESMAMKLTSIATRQYAKRQMTWFRRERDVHWIDASAGMEHTLQAARVHIH